MVQSVRPQIEALRQKLLELTLRNRMLNFRPSTRLGITVTGEDASEIYRILVENARKMSFVGKPDPPKRPTADPQPRLYDDPVATEAFREEAVDELHAYLEAPYATVSQTDTSLNTDELVYFQDSCLTVSGLARARKQTCRVLTSAWTVS